MGNFEKLSVLVIVVIIVMILVVALYTWTDNPDGTPPATKTAGSAVVPPIPGPDKEAASRKAGDLLDDWDRFNENGDENGDENGEDKGEDGLRKDHESRGSDDILDVPPLPDAPDPLPQPKKDPAAASQEEWMYTVKAGDTITEIAERELGTWRRYKEILKLNPGVKAETIREGDTLKMPPKGMADSMKVTPSVPGSDPLKGASSSKAPGGKIATGEHYTIRKGDRLSRISKRAYGTIDRWPELWARNLSTIDDPDEPKVGAKIFIPK